MKKCSKCKTEKPLADFYKHKSLEHGVQAMCKECSSQYRKAWHAKKTKELGHWPYKYKQREYNLRHHYGLKPEDVPDRCQVCTSDLRVCVDHDHNTGKVRGFLCDRCNVVLGRVKDDPKLLRQLAEYLEKI